MNNILTFFLILIFFSFGYSQSDYPEPPRTATRLFYIQHSNNHNTYVYDANIKERRIDASHPINAYRIVYMQDGVKKPLTSLQKKLAYEMILLESQPNLFIFHLSATENIRFYLSYDEYKGARVYVTINKTKMYLDKMFIQLKDGFLGFNYKVEYVLLNGKDYNSHEPVSEKFIVE